MNAQTTNYYPTTFLNESGNENRENLKEYGIKHMLGRAEDFEFFMNYGPNDDPEETKDNLRGEDLSFSEMRNLLFKIDDLPEFFNYGLCFDFVEVGTFNDQNEGYYRYQLSWGGPSEEIRFYHDGRIEFVFLDWFVGVGFDVTGEDWAEWLSEWFTDVGLIDWESLSPEQIYSFDEEEEL